MKQLIERLRQYSESLVAYKLGADFADAVCSAADMLENHASDRAALVAEIEKLRKQVRHGRWLKIEERMVLAYNTHFPMTITSETCSECNVRSGFLGKKGYVKDNSCPNCGVKMDGDDYA